MLRQGTRIFDIGWFDIPFGSPPTPMVVMEPRGMSRTIFDCFEMRPSRKQPKASCFTPPVFSQAESMCPLGYTPLLEKDNLITRFFLFAPQGHSQIIKIMKYFCGISVGGVANILLMTPPHLINQISRMPRR